MFYEAFLISNVWRKYIGEYYTILHKYVPRQILLLAITLFLYIRDTENTVTYIEMLAILAM